MSYDKRAGIQLNEGPEGGDLERMDDFQRVLLIVKIATKMSSISISLKIAGATLVHRLDALANTQSTLYFSDSKIPKNCSILYNKP